MFPLLDTEAIWNIIRAGVIIFGIFSEHKLLTQFSPYLLITSTDFIKRLLMFIVILTDIICS